MIKIYPGTLNGTINAPASKDHAQRLLFMSALAESRTVVKNVQDCGDIDTTIACLKEMGCRVERNGSDVTVDPFPKNTPVPTADFDFRDSATCCRFALAISGALGIRANCKGNPVLQRRRLRSLTSRMALRGVRFTNFSLPCSTDGRLMGGEYVIESDEAAQTASALLIALPMLRDDSTLKIEGKIDDEAFLEYTISSLAEFGIDIERKEDGSFFIRGKQFYRSPGMIAAENDWSLSSIWITAAAACGREDSLVTVTGLQKNSPQKFRDVQSIINLLHFDFYKLNIDASECPDLATLFAALALVKGATIEISGVPELQFRDTNRLKTMQQIASQMGQKAYISGDMGSISIKGTEKCGYDENTVIDCKDDPWIFMSMVLASATMPKPLILSDEHGADKIYRNFLRDFAALGGKYEIIKEE